MIDINRGASLIALVDQIDALNQPTTANAYTPNLTPEAAAQIRRDLDLLKTEFSIIGGVPKIITSLGKMKQELNKNQPSIAKLREIYGKIRMIYENEVDWRRQSAEILAPDLQAFLDEVHQGIAIRTLPMLPTQYRRPLAWCLSAHRDVSLRF